MGVWGTTPRQSVEAACARRGRAAVVGACLDVLNGAEADDELLLVLAGPAAQPVMVGQAGGKDGYWPRVWAMRGLMYAWEPRAAAAVLRGTNDEAWRVREMALKVIARHRLDEGLDAAVTAQQDQVRRVRAAAERATQVLVGARG